MRLPLLVNYFQLLPEPHHEGDLLPWAHQYRKALVKYQQAVAARYNEAALERLLSAGVAEVRQAAALALGLLGTMNVNQSLAARLGDAEPRVADLAADAMWSIWFRAGSPAHNEELQRLMQMELAEADIDVILAGFDALIRKAPCFAEAINQRAIIQFRRGAYAKSISDCEKVLRLNKYHFGAAGGMAQCFMRQNKYRAALRCYRRANKINPRLDGVRHAIESLEKALGEEGKR